MNTKTYEEKTAELRKFYGISREQYEKLAADMDVETMSDNKISFSYGVENGIFEPSDEYTENYCIMMKLAHLRLIGINENIVETPTTTQDYPNGRKLDCGCTVYNQSEVMNASMGTSCQNCYDRMSD